MWRIVIGFRFCSSQHFCNGDSSHGLGKWQAADLDSAHPPMARTKADKPAFIKLVWGRWANREELQSSLASLRKML